MITVLGLALVGYFLGSCPWGLIIGEAFCNLDPRQDGSHNTGATNVARLCGFRLGVAVLACDLLKGLIPSALAVYAGCSAMGCTIVALACVLGHVFSCFMEFKGGKAVATSIGVFLPLAFFPTLIACIVCIVVIWRKDFVSLGSLSLLASLPILLLICCKFELLPLSLILLALVAWRHRENIVRLRAGTEKPWRKSKQENAEGKPNA